MRQTLKILFVDLIIPSLIILLVAWLIYAAALQLHIILLLNLLNSSLLGPVVTIIVGSIALILYKKQKDDFKKDAANIILLEIKNAERLLKQAAESLKKDVPFLPENILVMQTGSWDKYKYLFVRDFDRDEWDAITDFYNKSVLYDQAVVSNNSYFQRNTEEIRVNLLRVLADYTKDLTDKTFKLTSKDKKEVLQTKTIDLINLFITKYMDKDLMARYSYNPQKPILDAKFIVGSLNLDLSLTTIGTKLKRMADLKE